MRQVYFLILVFFVQNIFAQDSASLKAKAKADKDKFFKQIYPVAIPEDFFELVKFNDEINTTSGITLRLFMGGGPLMEEFSNVSGQQIWDYVRKKIKATVKKTKMPKIPKGNSDYIKVAIIDSGIDTTNSYFTDRFWSNPDSNAKAKFGWDVANNDPNPHDDNDFLNQEVRTFKKAPFDYHRYNALLNALNQEHMSHGSKVASVVVEQCTHCQIIPIRVTLKNKANNILNGLKKAVELGARIVNTSIYTRQNLMVTLDPRNPEYKDQLLEINEQKKVIALIKNNPSTLFIFGANNASSNYFFAPNPYITLLSRLDNVIVVGSTAQQAPEEDDSHKKSVNVIVQNIIDAKVTKTADQTEVEKSAIPLRVRVKSTTEVFNEELSTVNDSVRIAAFSSFGTGINLYAPGEAIEVVDLNNQKRIEFGNSLAAPFVSALAAEASYLRPELEGAPAKAIKAYLLSISKNSRAHFIKVDVHPSADTGITYYDSFPFQSLSEESFIQVYED